ncbi:MAG: DUF3365 domain-containing protein [Actinomycetota bacterium]
MRRALFALALLTPLPAAADEAALKAEAAAILKDYAGGLQAALKGAMESGGPVAAIGACSEKSPQLASEAAAKSGWSVGRTSLKPRNQHSAPTAYETKVMGEFQARLAAGEPMDTLVKAETVDGVFHFVKAIPTAELCLNCHGSELKPEVSAKLKELYPADAATGFSVGQMRGVFTLSKKM